MPLYPSIPPAAGGGPTTLPYLTGVTVVPAAVTMSAGTQQFYTSGTLSGTNGISTGALAQSFMSWSSSDTAYLTVNQSGLATFVSGTGAGATVLVSASALGNVQGVVSVLVKTGVGPIIANSGTMLMNIFIDSGAALTDTQGNTWGTVGSPSVVAWTAQSSGGYGYWSGSDSAYFFASASALMPTGNFMMTVVARVTGANYNTSCPWTSLDNGYYCYGNNGNNQFQTAVSTTTTSGVPATPAYVVWSVGRDGTNQYEKINRGTTAQTAKGSPSAKTGIKIGNGTGAGQKWNGVIYNVWMSADAWDETAMAARNSGALAFFGV